MCSAPSVPAAKPLEPAKNAQSNMDASSDAVVRAQMMRRGIYSQFSQSRGYNAALQDSSTAVADTASGTAGSTPSASLPSHRSETLG